jgi:hypothetical protein
MLPKIKVPAELRALAEQSIDHAEQAFGFFRGRQSVAARHA